jgi:nitroreductase
MLEVMRSRRSIRRFRAEAPSREDLRAVLEAATTAPSASNRQPWRFVVVRDRDAIDRMAEAVRTAVARLTEAVDSRVETAFAGYAAHFSVFSTAPAVVLVGWRSTRLLSSMLSEEASDEDRRRIDELERRDGVVGASMAAQNLLLAAHERGLGAVFMTGALLAEPELREVLEIDDRHGILGLVPIGYPDESPTAPPRKPFTRVVRWIEKEDADD